MTVDMVSVRLKTKEADHTSVQGRYQSKEYFIEIVKSFSTIQSMLHCIPFSRQDLSEHF